MKTTSDHFHGCRPRLSRLHSLSSLLLACGVTFLPSVAVHATTTGMSTDPMGPAWDRLDPETGFATWDLFSGTNFTNDAPDASSGIASAGLTQSSVFSNFGQGAGLYSKATSVPSTGPSTDDVLFAGGNTVSFTLGGQVSFTIRGLALEIKRPGSTGTLADSSGFTPMLSINGGALIPADNFDTRSGSGDTDSDSGSWAVTTWYWGAALTSLPNSGSNTFALTFSKTNSQRLLDGFSVDVGQTALVPEPSSGLLAMYGLSALDLARRNRKPRAVVAPAKLLPTA